MNEKLNRQTSIERLYDAMKRYADGKKGIVYAISIEHARTLRNTTADGREGGGDRQQDAAGDT